VTIPDTPERRLRTFLLGLVIAVLAMECLVRFNDPLFEAASHRALTKAAIFGMHPRVDVLFLGTSRTQDGVSPDLVSHALAEATPEMSGVSGFNAAFTGSSLDALLALVPRLGFRRDVRVVVVELSDPQIVNAPASWEEPTIAPKTLEERLGRWMRASALVRHRKAFLGDNLGRLPSLLVFGASLSGWETKASQQIASWLGHRESPASDFESTNWFPRIFRPDRMRQSLPDPQDLIADRVVELAARFRTRGIEVRFAVPPISAATTNAPERLDLQPLFSEVARRSGCEVWDFSSAHPPESLFKDAGHLNREGRAHYSKMLGILLAPVLKGR
jgi:hypothetical protein